MLCNFTFHYTKNYFTWANLQPRAIRFELLNKTHCFTKIFCEHNLYEQCNPRVTIPGKSPIIDSLCEPEFHGHFRPHTNQHMIYLTKHNPTAQTSHAQSQTAIWASKITTIRSQVLGPIKRPFKASIQPKHYKTLK